MLAKMCHFFLNQCSKMSCHAFSSNYVFVRVELYDHLIFSVLVRDPFPCCGKIHRLRQSLIFRRTGRNIFFIYWSIELAGYRAQGFSFNPYYFSHSVSVRHSVCDGGTQTRTSFGRAQGFSLNPYHFSHFVTVRNSVCEGGTEIVGTRFIAYLVIEVGSSLRTIKKSDCLGI